MFPKESLNFYCLPKLTNKRKSEVMPQRLRMGKAEKCIIPKILDIFYLND